MINLKALQRNKTLKYGVPMLVSNLPFNMNANYRSAVMSLLANTS